METPKPNPPKGPAPHFDLPKLKEQADVEAKEIADAPPAVLGPPLARCHFCGALAHELRFVEKVGEVERFRGVGCCSGGNL